MSPSDVGEKALLGLGVILSGALTSWVAELVRRHGWKKEERLRIRLASFTRCLKSIHSFDGEVSSLEDEAMQGRTNPDFTQANALQKEAEDVLSIERAVVGPRFREAARKLVGHFDAVAESIAE